jgi:hypothetical protein
MQFTMVLAGALAALSLTIPVLAQRRVSLQINPQQSFKELLIQKILQNVGLMIFANFPAPRTRAPTVCSMQNLAA